MYNMTPNLAATRQIDGFLAACLVDSEIGMTLLSELDDDCGIDLDASAAISTQVMIANLEALDVIGQRDDVEDFVTTLGGQYHLIRPLSHLGGLFMFLVLDRTRADINAARNTLRSLEREVTAGMVS